MTKTRLIFAFSIFFSTVTVFSGCSAAKTTGKVAWEATKVGGKVAWEGTKLAGKGIKTTVNMVTGTTVVPLRKQGNSMFATVSINRRVYVELLVDTGAARTQISIALARQLGVDFSKSRPISVRSADGRMLEARQVYLNEVRIGSAVVRNVPAIVLMREETKGHEGLLGMTFLNEFIFQIDSEKGELVLKKRND